MTTHNVPRLEIHWGRSLLWAKEVSSSAMRPKEVAMRDSKRTRLAVVAVLVLCGLVAAGLGLAAWQSHRHAAQREQAVRDGVAQIHLLVSRWSVDNSDAAPPPARVTKQGLYQAGELPMDWPVNPYTGGPMQSGTGPGEYRYESWGMNGFRLTGYGPHGKTLIVQTVDDLSNE